MADSLEARDCTVTYRLGGRALGKAFVGRDLDRLCTELVFEQSMGVVGAAGAPSSTEPHL